MFKVKVTQNNHILRLKLVTVNQRIDLRSTVHSCPSKFSLNALVWERRCSSLPGRCHGRKVDAQRCHTRSTRMDRVITRRRCYFLGLGAMQPEGIIVCNCKFYIWALVGPWILQLYQAILKELRENHKVDAKPPCGFTLSEVLLSSYT